MKSLKIRKIISSIDNYQIREDLRKLVDLVEYPLFLKGIGAKADQCPVVSEFRVIRSYAEAAKTMTDQSVWDLSEPWPYQYFPDIVESENGRLMYSNGLSAEKLAQIDRYCEKFISSIRIYFYEKIDSLREKYNFREIISNDSVGEKINHTIEESLMYLINFCTYGGFATSPILCRFYEAFLTGGAPCAWVGPLPEDGGDPKDCLQILYRGPVTDPALIVG